MDGIDLRLKRTDEHLARLAEKVELATLEIQERGVTHEFEPRRSHYIVRINGKPPPAEWGVLVSELLHHFHSTLDNLVCDLVAAHGGQVHRHTAFPIALNRSKWEDATTTVARIGRRRGKTSALEGLSTSERTIIQEAQPYQRVRTGAPRDEQPLFVFLQHHPLAQLLKASLIDKHNLMHPCFIYVEHHSISEEELHESGTFDQLVPANATTCRAGDFLHGVGWSEGDYTEIIRCELTNPGPNPQMRMQGDFPREIALGYAYGPLKLAHFFAIRKEVQRLVDALRI
jgi:hypothetical protein